MLWLLIITRRQSATTRGELKVNDVLHLILSSTQNIFDLFFFMIQNFSF